jgi:hypothetical protein
MTIKLINNKRKKFLNLTENFFQHRKHSVQFLTHTHTYTHTPTHTHTHTHTHIHTPTQSLIITANLKRLNFYFMLMNYVLTLVGKTS